MTSPLRGLSAAASLVHSGAWPQTLLCAGCLAIASPTAVEGSAGYACTDFQKGGYQRTRRFSLLRRIRFRSREVPVSGRCAPHRLPLTPTHDFPGSRGLEPVVSAAQGVQVLRYRRPACFGPVVVERRDVVEVAACADPRGASTRRTAIWRRRRNLRAIRALAVRAAARVAT